MHRQFFFSASRHFLQLCLADMIYVASFLCLQISITKHQPVARPPTWTDTIAITKPCRSLLFTFRFMRKWNDSNNRRCSQFSHPAGWWRTGLHLASDLWPRVQSAAGNDWTPLLQSFHRWGRFFNGEHHPDGYTTGQLSVYLVFPAIFIAKWTNDMDKENRLQRQDRQGVFCENIQYHYYQHQAVQRKW